MKSLYHAISSTDKTKNMALAMGMVFYNQFTNEHAHNWLAWREDVTDPEDSLNKSPLMTILVLDKWLAGASENQTSFDAQRWTEQLLDACVAWDWPTNSSSTELYYRLGQMLSHPGRLHFIEDPHEENTKLSAFLEWCKILEDNVRPSLSASIAYQLEDNGVVLSAPQDAMLDALCTRLLNNHEIQGEMDILWRSPKVRTHAQYAGTLAQHAPSSLPGAINRCLLNGNVWEKSVESLATHACIFEIDPKHSNSANLLDALTLSYVSVLGSNVAPYAKAVWDTISHVWPGYAGFVHACVMMHGVEALDPTHAMRSTFIHYMQNLQHGKSPSTLAVEGMFEMHTG